MNHEIKDKMKDYVTMTGKKVIELLGYEVFGEGIEPEKCYKYSYTVSMYEDKFCRIIKMNDSETQTWEVISSQCEYDNSTLEYKKLEKEFELMKNFNNRPTEEEIIDQILANMEDWASDRNNNTTAEKLEELKKAIDNKKYIIEYDDEAGVFEFFWCGHSETFEYDRV